MEKVITKVCNVCGAEKTVPVSELRTWCDCNPSAPPQMVSKEFNAYADSVASQLKSIR